MALSCSDAADSVRQELASRRHEYENLLRKRFQRAVLEGDLPFDTDPADLARYLATVTQGTSVQAAGGTTREGLQKVVDLALRAFP